MRDWKIALKEYLDDYYSRLFKIKFMDLSIIICCYRGEKTIEECLLSLCSQTYDK